MATKRLTEKPTLPEDILNGAKTLSRAEPIWTLDVIPMWIKAEDYLSWAQRSLALADAFGYDAAVCYAKRAVCRLIDSLLVHNHLRKWEGSPYPAKMELLKETGIVIPDIAHDLIIDPRNDIEHRYTSASPDQARHAVQLAELLLTSLRNESNWAAIIALGMNYGPMIVSADNDGEPWPWGYSNNPRGAMLIVDMLGSDQRVMIIDHNDEEIRFAKLLEFTRDQTIDLARQLREQRFRSSFLAVGCAHHVFDDFKRRLGIND